MSPTLFSGDSLDLVGAIVLLNKSLEISLFVNIEKYINRMNIKLRIYVPFVKFGWTIHVLDLINLYKSSEVVHALTSIMMISKIFLKNPAQNSHIWGEMFENLKKNPL